MKLALSRLEARIEQAIGFSREVRVTIAGEPFVIDSACGHRGELNDYDYGWLRALAANKSSVLDIGSSVGLTALLFTRHIVPNGICVLADLSQCSLSLAARNLKRAGLLRRAAFARVRMADSDLPHLTALGDSIVLRNDELADVIRALDGMGSEVPNCTVDTLCSTISVTPDLIKIDVEGAEQQVLRGAGGVAIGCQPAIQVELHSFPPMTMHENARHTLDWCAAHGYQMWYLATGAIVRDAEQIASRGRCHVLLLPANRAYPAALEGIAQAGGPSAR